MATTMKDLMGSRRWGLLAAGVTLITALVLSLGATKAFATVCVYDYEASGCVKSTGYVTSISPSDGATGVSRNTNIKVTFSLQVKPDQVNGDTFSLVDASTLQQIPATVSMDPTADYATTFVLNPYGSGTGRLAPNRKYRVKVGGMEEHNNGRNLLHSEFSFTTAPASAPYVAQVSPPDGATGVSGSTNIKVTFSEEMDPATINGSTFQLHRYVYMCDRYTATCTWYFSQIPATVRKDPTDTTGRTYLLDPYDATSTLLAANSRFRVTLTTGVRDLEDVLSIPSKTWYFTTGSS